MSIILKTDPNLGNRKVILPIVGEVEVKDGCIEISKEDWAKLSKKDCGVKFIAPDDVKAEDNEPKQAPNELEEEAEEEDIQKKSEDAEPLNEVSEDSNPVKALDEYVSEPEDEDVSDPEANDSGLDEEDLKKLKVAELKDLASTKAEATGEEVDVDSLKKPELVEYLKK